MPKKLTTAEFIEKAKSVHGDHYDYSNVVYKNSKTNVDIICRKHGVFTQRPCHHSKGSGCKKCLMILFSDFVNLCNNKFKKKFVYNKGSYVNFTKECAITCPHHGVFFSTPSSHLNSKHGCPECANINGGVSRGLTLSDFVERSNLIHNGLYCYHLIKSAKSRCVSVFICKVHGEFSQRNNDHLQGSGCPKCGLLATAKKIKSNTDDFILASNGVHNNKYNYSLVEYEDSRLKVTITCSKHGDFEQTPSAHLSGQGCPDCAIEASRINDIFIPPENESAKELDW